MWIDEWIGRDSSRSALVTVCESRREWLVDEIETRMFLFSETVRIEFVVVGCIIAIVRIIITGSAFSLVISDTLSSGIEQLAH